MTTIYRPWSPSRGTAGPGLSTDRDAVVGIIGTLNQGAIALDSQPDWVLQCARADWQAE